MKKWIWLPIVALSVSACELNDDEINREKPVDEGTKAVYMVCEGLFNQNNSTLANYNFTSKTFTDDLFADANNRGLGDTASDAILYGNKIYIVVNGSGQVEVVDKNTAKSLKQISFFNADVSRSPRKIVGYKNKVYVCSFDGTVARIDTTTLSIEAIVDAGNVADGICAVNDKLYVSLCGDWNTGYDNRVSIIDIPTFQQNGYIQVGTNPTIIKSDSQGDVYVMTNGDYVQEMPAFHRIKTQSGYEVQTFDISLSGFSVAGNLAYLVYYNYESQESTIRVFDVRQEKLVSDNFITDDTVIETPYAIQVNPANGDVYVSDVHHYVTQGDLVCFSPEGKKRFGLEQVGQNPSTILFLGK